MPTYLAVPLGGTDAAACRAKLARPELECDATYRCDAVVFVVKDVATPGYHTALVCMMLGGAIVDSTYFLTNSVKGVSITYQPAGQSKKSIFVTAGFSAANPSLLATLDGCIANSKWVRVSSVDGVIGYHARHCLL